MRDDSARQSFSSSHVEKLEEKNLDNNFSSATELSHLRHSFAQWCLQKKKKRERKKCVRKISRVIRHIFNLRNEELNQANRRWLDMHAFGSVLFNEMFKKIESKEPVWINNIYEFGDTTGERHLHN